MAQKTPQKQRFIEKENNARPDTSKIPQAIDQMLHQRHLGQPQRNS